MAILAVAVYAALRFFPAGLSTIEHQKLATVATRLAQKEAARWQFGDRVPPFAMALVKSGWPGDGVVLDREVDPADFEEWLERAIFNPTTVEGGILVVREIFRVPPPDASGNCKYVLSYGPLAYIPGTGVAAVAYNPQSLERADVRDPSQLGANQYMVANWGTGRFVLQGAPVERIFKVDFTVAGTLEDVFDRLIILPANSTNLELNLPVVENSERIYEVYPASINRWGVVTFPHGFAGKDVAVDYIVADPHILSEEVEIPPSGGGGPIRVRLSLTHLLDEPLSPSHPFNIVAVDLESGEIYTEGSEIVDVDWKGGVVAFTPALGRKRVRVYYKSADGMALAVIKSPSLYVHYLPPDMSHPTGRVEVGRDPEGTMARVAPFPRQFRFEAEIDPKDGALTLFFPPSEGGKAVSVDYMWEAGAVERGEILSIPEGGPYEAMLQRRPVVLPLLSVRGTGLKVRVSWIEKGGKVRKTDLDAVLPPERAG